jgi:hypothetical protein
MNLELQKETQQQGESLNMGPGGGGIVNGVKQARIIQIEVTVKFIAQTEDPTVMTKIHLHVGPYRGEFHP